jgi:hypothetical protein
MNKESAVRIFLFILDKPHNINLERHNVSLVGASVDTVERSETVLGTSSHIKPIRCLVQQGFGQHMSAESVEDPF